MILSLLKSMLGPKGRSDTPERPLEEHTDEELMIAYGQGNARAFELLMGRHERGLFHYILRSCGRADVAEEMLQEVFLRVIRSADRYAHTAKFSTWLYTIARNLCIDRARKRSRTKEYSLNESIGHDVEEGGTTHQDMLVDEGAETTHMNHERAQFMERLQSALAQLPEEQREVFLLKEVSGLKFREIAKMIDAPIPTVKSRMRYALQALRGHMAEYRDHHFDEEERMEIVPGGM